MSLILNGSLLLTWIIELGVWQWWQANRLHRVGAERNENRLQVIDLGLFALERSVEQEMVKHRFDSIRRGFIFIARKLHKKQLSIKIQLLKWGKI